MVLIAGSANPGPDCPWVWEFFPDDELADFVVRLGSGRQTPPGEEGFAVGVIVVPDHNQLYPTRGARVDAYA